MARGSTHSTVGSIVAAGSRPPHSGFEPRTLNGFELQIVEAWKYDVAIVYLAVDAWMTNAGCRYLFDKASKKLASTRRRGLSPIAACDEIRNLIKERGFNPL